MNRIRLLLIAAAGVPLMVFAQRAPVAAVADGQATAAPLAYQSAFDGYQPFVEQVTSPDKSWIQANKALIDTPAPDAQGALDGDKPVRMAPRGRADARPVAVPHQGHDMHRKGH